MEEKQTDKKMSIKKKILISVVSFLIVLGGVGLIWGEEIVNKLMFAMPAETQLHSAYYNFAKELGENSGVFVDEYKKTLEMDTLGVSGTFAVRFSNVLKKMLGFEIDEIDRIYLNYEGIQEKNDNAINLELGIGKTKLISLHTIMDYEEGTMTLYCPELSETAVVADLESDLGYDMSSMANFAMDHEELAMYMENIIPEGVEIEKVIPEYVETIIKTIDVVERKESTLTVGGVSQEATALIVNFDDKMVEKIAKAIYKKLINDKELKSYMKDIYELSLLGEEVNEETWNEKYENAIQEVEKALLKLKDEEIFKKGIRFVTWVDSNNQIIGIELGNTIAWKTAEEGKKEATEFAVVDSGKEVFRILSEGKNSGESFSGDVTLYIEGKKIISLEVAKWVYTSKKYECDAKIVLDDNVIEKIIGQTWIGGDIILQFTGEGNEESTGFEVALLLGENEILALEFQSNGISEDVAIERPSKTIDFSKIEDWLKNIDLGKIIDNLEKIGFSKLDLLGYFYDYGL